MELFGKSLNDQAMDRQRCFTLATTCYIGLHLTCALEKLHRLGYVHLDLKPENILVGSSDPKNPMCESLKLIDFGISKSYLDSEQKHVIKKRERVFQGSILFASTNAFKKYRLSRRDDFISLGYLLIYLLTATLPWQETKNDCSDIKDYFAAVGKIKLSSTPALICRGRALPLAPFFHHVFRL